MSEILNKRILKSNILFYALLALIIIFGLFFRIYGINWDREFHLHPDERFLTMVASSISSVSNFKEYFDTNQSSLNPHNILDHNNNSVFPFFVYGTLPLFIVRYISELFNQTGYGQIHIIGRYLSALVDIGTVILIFIIAQKLFEKKWLSLTASFLYACCVLPIQISHFFIVDNFTTFFSTLTFYASVRILEDAVIFHEPKNVSGDRKKKTLDLRGLGNYLIFGLGLGMAAASKINTVVLAALLPLAIFFKIKEKNILSKNKLEFYYLQRMVFSAFISFIVFRLFQPYAFLGPNFFDISLNPRWINNLRELSLLSSGESNYPPSLQWARRSFIFPIKNLVIWGMGIPLGLFSLMGFIFMGIKVFKGEARKYGLIWTFTAMYLLWQVTLWNPTMRYFLILYPPLIIMAAWFVIDLFPEKFIFKPLLKREANARILKIICIILLMSGTFLWAFSFMKIYSRPMTRIAASEWIYENIESAVNLQIKTIDKNIQQPLSVKQYDILHPGQGYSILFTSYDNLKLHSIYFDHISSQSSDAEWQSIMIEIMDIDDQKIISSTYLTDQFLLKGDSRGKNYQVNFDDLIQLESGKNYALRLTLDESGSSLRFFGVISLGFDDKNIIIKKAIHHFSKSITSDEPYSMNFSPIQNGTLMALELFRLKSADPVVKDLEIEIIFRNLENEQIIGAIPYKLNYSEMDDFRGKKIFIQLEHPIELIENKNYQIVITNKTDSPLYLNGSKPAKETDWDDALPLYMYGYNPFDTYEGLYPSDLNFQMYWDDNREKLERFIEILDQADYFFITSNRQWGSTTQIPERYPLTEKFYRELIGCPEVDVQKCFRDAKPGMYKGNLGFSLVEIFQSNPGIFNLEFNSQYAEEAFSVYDHPKVLIFKKDPDYNTGHVVDVLSSVDLRQILSLNPEQADNRPGSLLMSDVQFDKQRESGTWSEMFNRQSFINSNQFITSVIWYLVISIIGYIFFPLNRIAFKGLADWGFPLVRPFGLLMYSVSVWLLGSVKIDATPVLLLVTLILLAIINFFIFKRDRSKIIEFFKQNIRYILFVEVIALCLFIIFLGIRIGNPDLWHPYKGGEKPMDFAYLNAVIKSINFPPYDPWYSQGYINYYYFGFMLAAVPIKLLGIIPSIAYNLILPTFFAFTGLAAFCLVWNFSSLFNNYESKETFKKNICLRNAYIKGIIGILFVLCIGNLGTIQMLISGFGRIAEVNLPVSQDNLFGSITSFLNGIKLYLNGFRFPYYPGDWYWIPSRVIPGEPITEFPFFTFLYGDPHAHLFAYPFTIIVLCWGLGIISDKNLENEHWCTWYIRLLLGAIIVGSLRVINTWDFPVFLIISLSAIYYAYVKKINILNPNTPKGKKIFFKAISQDLVFIIMAFLIYYPYTKWYGQGYTSIQLWGGDKTSLWAYLTHWCFFIAVISFFLLSQFIRLLDKTPLSAIKPYLKYRKQFFILLVAFFVLIILLFLLGFQIAVVVFPILLLCVILFLFDSKTPLEKALYFLIAAGITLTFVVEVIVLRGDIGRMNTVFKFYLQAWTLLSLPTAIIFSVVVMRINEIANSNSRIIFQILYILLIVFIALFPIIATIDKINDRIAENIPFSLDGMEFMKYSKYLENDVMMDLNQDYDAITWVQEKIKGTPVIVEAQIPEYRWGSRFSIYTGLPSVLGWNWHQRQQRSINPPEWVFNRADDIAEFYSTEDGNVTLDFIKRYGVEYIILGQLEKAVYPELGLEKFEKFDDQLWHLVYTSEKTKIFQVIK